MAFFEKESTRSASARTLQTTSLIVIEGPDFEKLIHNYPSISLKLLATLSHRLRETNRIFTSGSISKITGKQTSGQNECRLLTVASAKDGYGKTTFATSLARMLSLELGRKVLFLDLDLFFGGGTHLLGVHSPRSIVDIINKFRQDESNFNLLSESIRLAENLFAVPAPRSFLEAEQIHSSDLITILKEARKHFDYIVADTGSLFDENLYTILDTSDVVFFMINFTNLSTVTDNVRFFHGISKLCYPRERLILLGNNVAADFSSTKSSKIFPYPVIGGLPNVAGYEPQFGKPVYDLNPDGPYCEVMRLLVRNILKETGLKPQHPKGGIFSLLFGEKDPDLMVNTQLLQLTPSHGSHFSPIISSADVRSQVKYVRFNLMMGYLDEAKRNLLSFMEYSQASAPLCELLGEILLLEEKKSEALEAFEKAISIDEKQHVALGYLANLSGSKASLEKAVAAVKEKIAANPGFIDLLNDYGKILMANELHEDAAVQLEQALKLNSNYLEAKLNLAECWSNTGKAEKAIKMLLDVENKNPRLYFTLGEIFYSTGRLYLAFKSYTKASNLYPSYPGLRTKLFELSGYMRKLESVIDLHEGFVNTNPEFPDLHTKLAIFYHLAGKTELALIHLRRALEINPGYQVAAIKFEMIQKDEINQMAKTHLEEDHPDTSALTRGMHVTVKFSADEQKHVIPEEAILEVKNVRTARLMQKAIGSSQIESGSIDIDCSPLGLLASQDILLFQIFDVRSSNIIRFAPHYLELDEIQANHCQVDLDLQPHHSDDLATCTKFFLVHLSSKQMADLVGNGSSYRATLRNAANGLEAVGHLNPENEEQISFVLNASQMAADNVPAVKPGDKLMINVQDDKNIDIYAMKFTVGKTDVRNFYKTIIPKETDDLKAKTA